MKARNVLCPIVAAALLVAAAWSSGSRAPRHVVFISLDTARADHFGFMGNDSVQTPNLDAFAAESIVFTDYMTVVPTTLASHTSLFTGKYPHHHGTPRNGFMVNGKNEMLAELLKQAGFSTAGFVGSFALDSRFDFAQGFDYYDEEFDILVGTGGAGMNQRLAEDVTDAVIRYLDERGVPDRLFLFAHYFDPHNPYTAPSPYDTLYDPEGREGLPDAGWLASSPLVPGRDMRWYARRQALQYAAEITYTDHHVGRLLSDLRERGVLDDAIVVVTSDHGENMWEHDEQFNHGETVYQSTMHAICVIRLPGSDTVGTRVEQLVASIDVLPTVLERLGLDLPDGIDGEVIPLDRTAGGFPPRVRYGEATKPAGRLEKGQRWANALKSRCVREERLKYICIPYRHTRELYDTVADPDERANLLADPTPEASRRADELGERLDAWEVLADPLPSHFDEEQREETFERLRSLGYLQ